MAGLVKRTPWASVYEMKQGGLAAIPLVMVLALGVSVVVIYLNRPLIAEQRASTNTYHATRAAQAASGGLAWALANLNGTKPAGRLCASNGQTPWKAACEWTEQGGLSCDCAVPHSGDQDRLGVGFQVTVSPADAAATMPDAPALWDVAVTGCSVPSERNAPGGCSASEGAALSALKTRLRFVSLLGQRPDVALTAGGPITLPSPSANHGLAWGGYAMGVYVAPTAPNAATQTGAAASDAVTARLPRDKLLGVNQAALRGVAWRLACEANCSEQLQRAVQSGHTVIWVDGDLPLASALTLGTDERPLLLWVEGEVRLGPRVSLTGLLMAGSVVWGASEEGDSQVKGAIVVDGPITATGSPVIEWAPQVLDRLAASAGWFEPAPIGRRVN